MNRFPDPDEANNWYIKEFRKLVAVLSMSLDAEYEVILTHATEHEWDQRCNAYTENEIIISGTDSLRLSESDAETLEELLEAYYVFRLHSEKYPLFDRNKFSSIRCEISAIDDRWFGGCQPQSFGERGYMGVYVLGKSATGALLAAPVNGTAKAHIEGMPQISLEDDEVTIGVFFDTVDIASVLEKLQ